MEICWPVLSASAGILLYLSFLKVVHLVLIITRHTTQNPSRYSSHYSCKLYHQPTTSDDMQDQPGRLNRGLRAIA
jgi:hypothetical protein